MFAFETNVRKGFRKVRNDFASLKSNLNEWVLFLNGNQRELKMRVQALEHRLEKLESRQELRQEPKGVEILRYV
ncbi:hypothetical protein ACFL96_05855 [Thermoproteota archaeon]